MAAPDPSHNVHPELLPHIHLISAYRYPLVPRFGIPDVTEWLLSVPRIAREGAPFFWTYLDTPQDGSIILTWQPLQRMGTDFASDGYVWPRGEVYYQHEIRDGLILEVFHQPVGYRPGDEYATHSRRRFRLMPPKVPNPNAPQVDPSLWLVHYGPIDEREPIPVKKIRLDARLRSIMDQRHNLQRAGQITRKEFMLSDRVNWPHIPLPRDARGPPGYTGAVPQQMAYPPHVQQQQQQQVVVPPGPPSKRARHAASQSAAAAAAASSAHLPPPPPGPGAPQQQHMAPPPPGVDASLFEDEEDYARGDMFDVITPRDVSLERYRQNHEWMEEIISSPYRIGQIGYADLGLGLKGELAPVTEGIFEGQAFDAYQRVPKKPYVGRLDRGLADAFRKRVNEKIAATEAEIAEMKAQHEKLVASFQTNSAIKKGEHDLRFTAEETGPEIWRIEGRLHDAGDNGGGGDGDNSDKSSSSKNAAAPGDEHWSHPKAQKTVDKVVSEVEHALGRKVVNSGTVVRVQDGGYHEPTPEPEPVPEPEPPVQVPQISVPGGGASAASATAGGAGGGSQHPSPANSQLSGILIGDADMDMGDAAGMLDQMESVFSNPSTPLNYGTPAQAGGPAAAAAAAGPGPGPTGLSNVATASGPGGPSAAAPAQGPQGHAASAAHPMTGAPAPRGGVPGQPGPGTDDWVVVPPGGGVTPPVAGSVPGQGGAPAQVPPQAPAAQPAAPASAPAPAPAAAPAAAAPPASKPPSAVPTPGGGGDDFGGLGDMDSAGMDDGLDLDMEDSAFGDAFHGSGAQ